MSLILKFALKLKGARAHCAAEYTQQPPLFLSPPPQFFTPRRRLLKRFNTKLKRRDNRIVDRLFVPDEFTQEVFKGRSLLRFRRGHVHVCRGSGGRRKKLDAGVHRRVQLRDLLDVVRVDELNWNVFRDDVAVFVEEVLLFFFFFHRSFVVVVFVVRVRVVVVALRNVLSLFVFEVWFLRCEKIGIGQFFTSLKAPLFFPQNFFFFFFFLSIVSKNHASFSLGRKSFLPDESELQPSKRKKEQKEREIKRFLT